MIKFSLLLCLYEKENPEHLKQCLESIDEASILPSEIVIVKDGPLTADLEDVLSNHRFPMIANEHPMNVIVVALPENVTLGPARAAGVEAATHEWVAIMDTDDICRRDRFEMQLHVIEQNPDLGLIGGQIAEFIDTPEHTVATRIVPTSHVEIVKFAKMRNPFNHMTVMLKKDAVMKAGNYRFFPWFEDYDLWTRMIKNGIMCANLSDILVDARIDNNTFGRRRGMAYIRLELKMQKQLRDLKLVSNFELLRNVVLRLPARILPSGLLASVYRKFIRNG
ncbi:MAG: glycosyltransferase [Oscillospiraceae bacterium]|nr:glycosyltransferase [Oscillospiraceae bacterium]